MSENAFIPHNRPSVGPREAEAVAQAVLHSRLAQGPEVAALESELAATLKLPYVRALGHGTGALHLCLLWLGAGPGREVILPSFTCVSLLNAVAYTGATPVLVDCRADRPVLDLEQVRRRVHDRTAAILAPHMFGSAVTFGDFAHTGMVIEDATHAVGGDRIGQSGAACIYSFYATKMLAAGEGGAIGTRHAELARFAEESRDYDQHEEWLPRFNYKMTDVAAAMLRVQVARLPDFLERRRRLVSFYLQALAGTPGLILPDIRDGEAPYRFVVRFPDRALKDVEQGLQELGIGTRRPVFRPVHRYLHQPDEEFPQSLRWWKECLSLPLYPDLTREQAERVARGVRQVLTPPAL